MAGKRDLWSNSTEGFMFEMSLFSPTEFLEIGGCCVSFIPDNLVFGPGPCPEECY